MYILNHCTGIGPVLNLRFSPTFSTIMWDPPSTAGVLSGLTYHLTVTNMNTGVVIINTNTTETSYSLSSVLICTFYNARVTAFSLELNGDTMSIMERIPGGECNLKFYRCTCCLYLPYIDYYKLMELSPHVLINNNDVTSPVITVIFNVVLQVHVVCVIFLSYFVIVYFL